MTGRPPRYTRKQVYVIEVMFLHGLPASRIARVMHRYGVPMDRNQVWTQIKQLGHRRYAMTKEERQAALDKLKANPLEDLPAEFFTVRA